MAIYIASLDNVDKGAREIMGLFSSISKRPAFCFLMKKMNIPKCDYIMMFLIALNTVL